MSRFINMSIGVAKNTPVNRMRSIVRAVHARTAQPLRGTLTSLKLPIRGDMYLSIVVDQTTIETVLVRMGPADVYIPVHEFGYDEPGYSCQFTTTRDVIAEYDRLRRLYRIAAESS